MSIDEDALVRLKLREAKIQNLLRARFPASWAPPPLSPVRGSARASVVSDIRPQIEAARAELQAKSDEELEAMHTAATEQQHKREAIKASIDEKGRFFNWRDANADFDYWAKLEYWTFDEALLLLHGKSPDVMTWKDLEPIVQVSAFAKKFAATRKLAMRAEQMKRGTGSVWPIAALDWAKQLDIDVPPALLLAVSARAQKTADKSAGITVGTPSDRAVDDQVSARLAAEPSQTETQTMPAPAVTLQTVKYSTKPPRRDTLNPVIEHAQSKCKDPQDTAQVWAQLQELAQEGHVPLLAAVQEGVKYTKNGKDAYFTRDALDKRLHPEKRAKRR
jgi:hypothetical protein